MEMIRTDKFLSMQLNMSRSDAKKLLKSGNVTVNGKTVNKGDFQFDPSDSRVTVNGRELIYKKHLYIMLNKPVGVVSASQSPGDMTVIDLVPEELRRPGLFPAGRLDKDTTGFVLITDDGEFAHDILSPSKHISKTYSVELERDVKPDEFELFTAGMELGDILLKPASLKKTGELRYEIIITEGRYHQIKRMFASVGNRVTALHRTMMGALALDDTLAAGQCRELTDEELMLIKESTINKFNI